MDPCLDTITISKAYVKALHGLIMIKGSAKARFLSISRMLIALTLFSLLNEFCGHFGDVCKRVVLVTSSQL